MFLGICLYLSWNSSGVRMSMVFGFWICAMVVMPNIYSLFKYFWVAVLVVLERLAYDGVFLHACSRGVILMGNYRLAVVTCISNSLSSRKSVLVISDLKHACCFSLGRWREPPYMAAMYLTSP